MLVVVPGATANGALPSVPKFFWKPIMNFSFSSSRLPLKRSRSRNVLLTPKLGPSPRLVYCQNDHDSCDGGPPTGSFHTPYGFGYPLGVSGCVTCGSTCVGSLP